MKKLIVALLLTVTILMVGCSSENDESTAEYGDLFGSFNTSDIYGENVTQKVILQNKFTLVEVWGTYCSACISGMKDTEKIYEKYKDKDFGVVGILVDLQDEEGSKDKDAMKTAQEIVKDNGVTYTNMLIPNEVSPVIEQVTAIPSFFFVNKKGKVVGDIYTGSKSVDEWSEIIDEKLEL